MAQRKKSSQELKLVGARAGRIRAREAEEKGIQPDKPDSKKALDPEQLQRFKTRIVTARDTFDSRIVPSCSIMLELGRVKFNWRTYAFLTIAHSYAEKNRQLPECDEFIRELQSEHPKHYLDVVQTEFIDKWFETFAPDPYGWELHTGDCFDLVRIIGWRNRDGSVRHDPKFWETNSFRNVIAQGFKVANSIE